MQPRIEYGGPLLPSGEPIFAGIRQLPAAEALFYQVHYFKPLVGPFRDTGSCFDVRQSLKLILCQGAVRAEKEARCVHRGGTLPQPCDSR
jgi:hypothetical protein